MDVPGLTSISDHGNNKIIFFTCLSYKVRPPTSLSLCHFYYIHYQMKAKCWNQRALSI
jgi:hypothetical protein